MMNGTSATLPTDGSTRRAADCRQQKKRNIGDLLKEVYEVHADTVNELENEVDKITRKCNKLQMTNKSLLSKGIKLQRDYDQLIEQHRTLREELSEARLRLAAPCANCELLRSQLSHQLHLYSVVRDVVGNSAKEAAHLGSAGGDNTAKAESLLVAKKSPAEKHASDNGEQVGEVDQPNSYRPNKDGGHDSGHAVVGNKPSQPAGLHPVRKKQQEKTNTWTEVEEEHRKDDQDHGDQTFVKSNENNSPNLSQTLLDSDKKPASHKGDSMGIGKRETSGCIRASKRNSSPGMKQRDREAGLYSPRRREDQRRDSDGAEDEPVQTQAENHDDARSLVAGEVATEVTTEVSPNSGRSLSLRLARSGKRPRCKYSVEPLVPEAKKVRRSEGPDGTHKKVQLKKQGSAPMLLQPHTQDGADTCWQVYSVPQHLVPETCDPNQFTMATSPVAKGAHGASPDHSGKKMRRRMKPNIIIPETVPMDFDEFESETSSPSEEDTIVEGAAAKTVLSPPSLSSTPSGSRKRDTASVEIPKHQDKPGHPDASFYDNSVTLLKSACPENMPTTSELLLGGKNDDTYEKNEQIKSPDTHHGDETTAFDPTSPVFGGGTNFVQQQEALAKSSRSPSLFDDEEGSDGDEDRADATRYCSPEQPKHSTEMHPHPRIETTDACLDSTASPSVLSGKALGRIAQEDNSERKEASRSQEQLKYVVWEKNARFSPPEKGDNLSSRLRSTKTLSVSREATPIMRSALVLSAGGGVASDAGKCAHAKHLVQTKLSPASFKKPLIRQPPRNSRPAAKLTESQIVLSEEKMLMQAKRESLEAFHREQSGDPAVLPELTFTTGPELTSTPMITEERNHGRKISAQVDRSEFKEPPVPVNYGRRTTTKHTDHGSGYYSPADSRKSRTQGKVRPLKGKSHDLHDTKVCDPDETRDFDPGDKMELNLGHETSVEDTQNRRHTVCQSGHTQLDKYHMGSQRELNGTIDPCLRLSEYDTPAEEEEEESGAGVPGGPTQYLEAITFMELDERQYVQSGGSSSRSIDRQLTAQGDEEAGDEEEYSAVFSGRRSGRLLQKIQQQQEQQQQPEEDDDGEDKRDAARCTQTNSLKATRRDVVQDEEDHEPQSCPDVFAENTFKAENVKVAPPNDDSFNILPKKPGPDYAFVDVVRKHAERRKLDAHACQQCEDYFSSLGLPEEEKRARLKNCRHKALFVMPGTPEHYWSIGFPDTQECEDRGYLNKTQAKPSDFRRRRRLRQLFGADKEDGSADEEGSEAGEQLGDEDVEDGKLVNPE